MHNFFRFFINNNIININNNNIKFLCCIMFIQWNLYKADTNGAKNVSAF